MVISTTLRMTAYHPITFRHYLVHFHPSSSSSSGERDTLTSSQRQLSRIFKGPRSSLCFPCESYSPFSTMRHCHRYHLNAKTGAFTPSNDPIHGGSRSRSAPRRAAALFRFLTWPSALNVDFSLTIVCRRELMALRIWLHPLVVLRL